MTPQQLRLILRNQRQPHKTGKIPPNQIRLELTPKTPSRAITEYEVWVYQLISGWQKDLLIQVKQAAEQDGYRTDAIWGKVRLLLANVKNKIAQTFSSDFVTRRLKAFSTQVEQNNLKTDITGLHTLKTPNFVIATDTFLQNNIKLITSIPEADLDAVYDIFSVPGQSIKQIAEQLEERFSVSRSRAQLIARDQTLKLNGAITKERQRQAGIIKYVWTTSRDERVRGNPFGRWPLPKSGLGGNHYRLDGTVQLWNSPPIVDTRVGRRAHPGEDYQCRCTAFPLLEGIEDV